MGNLIPKIKNLPLNIQDVIFSESFGDLNGELTVFMISDENRYAKIADLSVDLFAKDLKVSDLIKYLQDNWQLKPKEATAKALEIAGKRLLTFDNYFNGGVSQFIADNGGDVVDYREYVERQQQIIQEAEAEREREAEEAKKAEEPTPEDIVEDAQSELTYVESDDAEEKKWAPKLFQESLVQFFTPDEAMAIVLTDYNLVLLKLLIEDPKFKHSLESALYSNQQLLTSGQIYLKGKMVSATVANYIQDFIEKNGSSFFENIALTQYLISSENAKRLDSTDRMKLKKMLNVYRNIKFFPQAFDRIPVEQWMIIPVEDQIIDNTDQSSDQKNKSEEIILDNATPLELRALAEQKRKNK